MKDESVTRTNFHTLPFRLPPSFQENVAAEARAAWIEKHNEWIAKVPRGKHLFAEKTGHFIQLQEPRMVIDALREIVTRKP